MGATSRKTVAGTFCFHIWGPKHVGYQAHLEKVWLESTRFSAGTPSLLLGLMAQASLEEFQLSTLSPHDIIDVCRLRGRGPKVVFAPSPIEIGLGCDAQHFSPFRALPLRRLVIRPGMSQYACSACLEHYKFFLARVFPGGRASGSVWLADWSIS